MSNIGRSEAHNTRGGTTGQSGGTGPGECAAESLKSLIAHVADQIADADHRHTEMLRQMQARLQVLGIEAKSIRDRVPGEYVPAFDRIEEGMQLLADRIASTHDARPEGASTAEYATAPPPASPAPKTEPITKAGQAPAAPAAQPTHTMPVAAQPTALDPWERDQAEALANLYHGSVHGSGQAAVWPKGVMADPDADAFDRVERLADPVVHAASAAEIEREWLEDRFADIAQRVEQSLAEMRPDSSFLALGNRFEQFEQRMGSVLEDVATRADVEGLRIIEAHISELAAHLEQTQIQLERLDVIESQLNAVVDRLSDERAPNLGDAGAIPAAQIDAIVSNAVNRVAQQLSSIQTAASRAAPDFDYQNIANLAAQQAVSRYAADFREQARGMMQPDDDRTGELRDILEGFISERREGEAQTASALDTMQQAIVRVLDRIDSIELSQHHAAVPAAPREYVREQVRFTADPRESADLGSLRAAADSAKYAANAAAHMTAQMQPQTYSAAGPSPFAHAPGAHLQPAAHAGSPDIASGLRVDRPEFSAASSSTADVAAAPSAAGPAGMTSPPAAANGPRVARAPIDKLRQDFIADAQRAKLRAQSQNTASDAIGAAVEAGAAKLSAPKSTAGRPVAAAPAASSKPTAAGKAASGLPIKKLLVGALGLVIVVQGANLLLARRKADAPKPAATETKAVVPPASGNAVAPAKDREAVPAKANPRSTTAVPQIVNPAAVPADALGRDQGIELAPDSDGANPVEGLDRRSNIDASEGVDEAVPVAPKAGAQTPASQVPSKKNADAKKPGAPDPTQFALPKAPGAPASVPETVIEELNYNNSMPSGRVDQRISDAQITSTSEIVPVGISLQSSARPLTPHDLARLQQQQQMATLSSKLGVAAANATPASLMPDRVMAPESSGNVAAALAEQAKQQKSALELPPLTVGPLSLRLAAAKGDPSAEFEVATRLAEGKGTEQSFKDAVKWYTRSATQGFAQAQYRLGTLYERGLGVKQDVARARVWYSRAAEQENIKAMHNLAVLNAGTKSSAPDYSAAAHWFSEAATRGLADSQFNLAVLHESGLGVAKDQGLAYQWFALAARSGDKEAVRRRDLLKSQLSATESAEIDQRIAVWAPKATDQIVNDPRVAGEAWKARESVENNG